MYYTHSLQTLSEKYPWHLGEDEQFKFVSCAGHLQFGVTKYIHFQPEILLSSTIMKRAELQIVKALECAHLECAHLANLYRTRQQFHISTIVKCYFYVYFNIICMLIIIDKMLVSLFLPQYSPYIVNYLYNTLCFCTCFCILHFFCYYYYIMLLCHTSTKYLLHLSRTEFV